MAETADRQPKQKKNIMRRLYDWVLGWSESKWGMLALFLISFAESSFFPIPPDVLLIALCLGSSRKSFHYAAVCTMGSVLGALGGYVIGYFLWHNAAGDYTTLANWFYDHMFTAEDFNGVKEMFDKYNFWVIFAGGFTPIPYKLFTIAAGVFHINIPMFVIGSIVARGFRFFLVAGLLWKFGAPIKVFIDKYFNWLAIAFTVLLIGSFVLMQYIL